MDEQRGCGTVLLIAVVVGIWLYFGNGWATVREWTGQSTYEDQRATLETFIERKKVGASGDVWLVKGNLGVEDRVALFFGYLDDWDACYEFAKFYMERYPLDTYSCRSAN